MRVTIKIIGCLIHQIGYSEKEMDIPSSSSLKDLQVLLGIDDGSPRVITRNGKYIAQKDKLAEGDCIVICHLYSGR